LDLKATHILREIADSTKVIFLAQAPPPAHLKSGTISEREGGKIGQLFLQRSLARSLWYGMKDEGILREGRLANLAVDAVLDLQSLDASR
jgi:hypothetical protein